MKQIKCVVVGDGLVGKTCLLLTYTTSKFPVGYNTPTICETYDAPVRVSKEPCTLRLFDTSGAGSCHNLLFINYYETDVVLVCFSVVSPDSFKNVRDTWVPEVNHYCQKTPFLLVGTQIDLRDDEETVEKLTKKRQNPITFEMGEKLARELKAVKYVECSALTQKGLKKVFDEAILATLVSSDKATGATIESSEGATGATIEFSNQTTIETIESSDKAISKTPEPSKPQGKKKCVIL